MATTIDLEKPATADLTASLEGMRAALDNLGTNVFIADRDLRLVYMNQRASTTLKTMEQAIEQLFGLRHADLLGVNIDVFHGERTRQIRRLLSDPSNLPYRREIKLGAAIMDLNVNAMRNERGEYIGVVVNWEEIAERKRLETESAENAAMFRAIGKSLAVIEFQMDGTIMDANENFLKALGYTAEEIKGKHHGMFVDAAYRDSAEYKEFWATLNRGEFVASEFKRIAKGGREVWIQASYKPYFRYQFVNDKYADPINILHGTYYGPSVGLRIDFAQYAAFKLQYNHLFESKQPAGNGLNAQVAFTF